MITLKIKHISILFCFLSLVTLTWGQTMRLNSWKYLTDVSTDLNQLFNYNRYEGQRWGAGLQITAPLKYDIRRPREKQNALQFNLYGAYGTFDRALKGGASVALLRPMSPLRSVGIAACHDLDRAGSRQLGSYSVTATYNNSSYVANQYIGVNRISFGINRLALPANVDVAAHVRLSREDYRFNQNGLLYPRLSDPAMPKEDYAEGRLTVKYHKNTILQTQFGHMSSSEPALVTRTYARLIIQYSNEITANLKRNDKLYIYLQGGIATPNTPYGRLFDLSGTAGYYYFFRNSFMTVAQNSFTAHQYAMFCLHYLWGKPLWSSKLSNPQPFLQLGGMWGSLSGCNYQNSLIYSLRTESATLPTSADQIGRDNIISLTAPSQGLLEPSFGIERLLRWGVLELGAACAYQITPSSATYHLEQGNRWGWMIMANMILDYKN
jgi:hypothetical protein